jgi:hypothetical protein
MLAVEFTGQFVFFRFIFLFVFWSFSKFQTTLCDLLLSLLLGDQKKSLPCLIYSSPQKRGGSKTSFVVGRATE